MSTSDVGTTADLLLEALRHHTETEDLKWAREPRPLTGGFWAEMYDVELVDPTEHLAGRFAARIMPNAETAEFETTVQRYVNQCGLSAPAVRCSSGPGGILDRAWMLMDYASGQPMLDGLSPTNALRQIPKLVSDLPHALADASALLHRCPSEGLQSELAGRSRQANIEGFLQRIADQALANDRQDLADAARTLTTKAPTTRVICHGDLHPFNLLVDDNGWTLIDWSAAVIADPHYDLAFTTLMLANPPLVGPAVVGAAARLVGKRLANRFLDNYQELTGSPIDPDRLAWGQQIHALRALVELSTWEAQGTASAHAGHPWFTLQTLFETQLATL